MPKTAVDVVHPQYIDLQGKPVGEDAPADKIAESVYTVRIKPGILFAPHPAFAKDAKGGYLYHRLSREQLGDKRSPWQFEQTGTRELTADDFVYAVKRHATTRTAAPVFGVFSEYVVGWRTTAS